VAVHQNRTRWIRKDVTRNLHEVLEPLGIATSTTVIHTQPDWVDVGVLTNEFRIIAFLADIYYVRDSFLNPTVELLKLPNAMRWQIAADCD
jgi:hypothetical protein